MSFIALEMSITRMLMFSNGAAVLDYDRAAVEAMKKGVSPNTIAVAATVFGRAAKTLPEARASRIRPIMTGGFVTRLKMEAAAIPQPVVA